MGALYTGARPNELTNLRIENVLGSGIFVPGVIAKTNQPRTIVLEQSAQSFFYALIAQRTPQELMFTHSGKQWKIADLWRYTRAACEKAELDEMTFYALRHSAAGNWLRAGVPIKYIAEQLGHSVLVCERYYAHIGPDRRAELFANLPKPCIIGHDVPAPAKIIRCGLPADLRTRCKILTWQELACCCLPTALERFLSIKYGIVFKPCFNDRSVFDQPSAGKLDQNKLNPQKSDTAR
jgi:hypothetical protein